MQGSLLVMCLLWRARQYRLGIDDFGNPLDSSSVLGADSPAQSVLVNAAIEAARESDVRIDVDAEEANEATPLLAVKGDNDDTSTGKGWFDWIKKWI